MHDELDHTAATADPQDRWLIVAIGLWAACAGPPHRLDGDHDAAASPGDAAAWDGPPDAIVDAAPDSFPGNPHGIRLVDITDHLGARYPGGRLEVDPWGVGSGAAAADMDGDGRLDVFLARCDTTAPPGGPSVLLRQIEAGPEAPVFEVDADMAAAFAGTCARAAVFGDYDGDGALDLFVAMDGPDRLYRNQGSGRFVDVTAEAGVAGPGDDINTSAYFVDVNHDGLLDLLVLGQVNTLPPRPTPSAANRLYLNQGDGTFRDVSALSGVAGEGSSQAALIADLDGDGDLEIYVANDRFALNGERPMPGLDADQWLDPVSHDDQNVPIYVDRGEAYAVTGPRSSMGVAVADLSGDDREDIYVADWGANHLQMWNPALGQYEQRAHEWSVDLTNTAAGYHSVSWGVVFTDLDRDGALELIVANGWVYEPMSCQAWSQENVILRRDDGGPGFLDITASVGWPRDAGCAPPIDVPSASRGVLLADLDGDGDDDVIITPFIEAFRFYRNDTPHAGRRWLRLALTGTVSAPTPHGAILRVTRTDGAVIRRSLPAGGTHTQAPAILEAGLGHGPEVLEATLAWPSGYVQRLDLTPGFVLDTTWSVTEPAWLRLSARAAGADDEAPVLVYRPVDERGEFVGAPAAGRSVTVTRSDGQPVTVTDQGDGSYVAGLPHPGAARVTVVRVSDGGHTLRPRLTVRYR